MEGHDALAVDAKTFVLEGALDLLDPLQLADASGVFSRIFSPSADTEALVTILDAAKAVGIEAVSVATSSQ